MNIQWSEAEVTCEHQTEKPDDPPERFGVTIPAEYTEEVRRVVLALDGNGRHVGIVDLRCQLRPHGDGYFLCFTGHPDVRADTPVTRDNVVALLRTETEHYTA